MRWYRIEFFKTCTGYVQESSIQNMVFSNRIDYVERQYTTYRRALASADKMQYRYSDCVVYTLTVL